MSYDGPSEDTSALLNLGVVIPSSSERRDDAYTSKSHLLQDTGLCHSSTVFFLMTGMGHVAENCFRSQVDSYDESLLRKTSGRTGRLFPLDRSFSQDYMGSHHEAKRNKLYLLAPSPPSILLHNSLACLLICAIAFRTSYIIPQLCY